MQVWVVEHRTHGQTWTPIHAALSWAEADRWMDRCSKEIRETSRITSYVPQQEPDGRKPPSGETLF
jgi:hypothetical protein